MITIHINIPIPPEYRWGIVRHVTEGFGPQYTPSYQGTTARPVGTTKGPESLVGPDWWRFIRAQNNDKGYAYARSIGVMWINTQYDQDNPDAIAHAVNGVGGGAFVLLDAITATHARMVAFDCKFDPTGMDPSVINWNNYPYLFFKAASIDVGTGDINNVGNGYDCYIPNLRGWDSGLGTIVEKWVIRSDLELFPDLPFTLQDGRIVVQYRPRGASVFGKLSTGEWIYLLKSTVPGERVFPTNWMINTLGPIPPAI